MAERICMDYEIAKKIVEAGDSKIFKNWHEHTGVSKEDFLAGIEWLCENVIISECDCSQCPTRELCEALCAYDNR